ncbi:phosphoserine transaminase [Leucobacter sp. NPDC015123]|uniref:phosphoserine transaminase n=1 Tax=Leucobacter sp. NPDC015123 TaxID=3364129 RepID=UPI0036F49043
MDLTYPSTLPRYPLRDGRFGSGPAKIRPTQLQDLVADPLRLLGTSHRQPPVSRLVGRIQEQLHELFDAPEGYEVVLGNGGSTAFWDIAAFSLVDTRAQCLDFGVFGSRFARAAAAPWLTPPDVRTAPHGELVLTEELEGIDTYAWPHNETSTGVLAPVRRVGATEDAITLIDGTSAAGGTEFDARNADVYYFAPQKNFGSDAGIWIALLSPAAIDRASRIATSGRYIPDFLNLYLAIEQSRKQQTLNTPALATLMLLENQISWILEHGGLAWAAGRTRSLSTEIYDWAERSRYSAPFVTNPALRSPTNVTLEIDPRADTRTLAALLRSAGIFDTDGYVGVGRNQLRIGTYVSIDPADVGQLLQNLDVLIPHAIKSGERPTTEG